MHAAASPNMVCNITSNLLSDNSLVLRDDELFVSNERNVSTKRAEFASAKTTYVEERATFQKAQTRMASAEQADAATAKADYLAAKDKFQAALARLMTAMEALLDVPSVSITDLTEMLGKNRSDTLVVFYAPWCWHCRRFVLEGLNGDPTKSPLELFRRSLKADAKTNHVDVTRVDITTIAVGDIPKAFDVTLIPSVYFVSSHGQAVHFNGSSHDTESLKAFVIDHLTQ
eukprot:TRINITY_DN58705_c0_g1_i1.p1 TRINITY_DN58705_c0_g1~~TRINITY_DN58705_c0_g1_i1.p1  ORF type:complete len:268 (-),score=40.26 TRINITY_DN58705_c0_g1_i1:309-995(-)